ncbi:DUF1643 domain-containing protein [Bacteroidota bacterium]
MARIGRQVLHFEHVNTDSIKARFSDTKSHRYTLEITFFEDLYSKKREKSIVVILKNPSSADEKMADSTIRKVETYVYLKFPDVKYLRILNIFAIRGTDPEDVNSLLNEKGFDYIVGPENNDHFEEIIGKSDYVICAWGGNSGINKENYNRRISEVKQIINKVNKNTAYQVCGKQNTLQPLHGLMWGYDYILKKINIL